MASAVFASMLILTITHGVLVTKGVRSLGRASGRGSDHAISPTPVSQTASRIRLLAMHCAAALATGAGLAKYALPVSDAACRGSHRAMIAGILLYDASLVLFLLAKTSVTNGTRNLAGWEMGIIWWSRLYAWVYLPTTAVFLSTKIPGVANDERTYCLIGAQDRHESKQGLASAGFVTNNAMLVVQFAVLLAMFLKPLLVSAHDGTEYSRASYRHVMIRNVVCTVGIAVTYAITTVVVVVGISNASSPEGNIKADQLVDIAPPLNIIATLCLTEIALPLGFCSSCSRCANVCNTKTAIIRQEGHHPEEEDHHARAEVAMQQRPVNVDEKLGVNPQQPARSSVVAEG